MDWEVELLFVRHAMSIDNEAWLLGLPWPGLVDAPLCGRGYQTLPQIAGEVARWSPTLIISSPLKRCIQTAQAISSVVKAKIEIDYRLTEIVFNDGDRPPTPRQIKTMYPDLNVRCSNKANSGTYCVRKLATKLVRELAIADEKKICLVGHRGWFNSFVNEDIGNGEMVYLKVESKTTDFQNSILVTVNRRSLKQEKKYEF